MEVGNNKNETIVHFRLFVEYLQPFACIRWTLHINILCEIWEAFTPAFRSFWAWTLLTPCKTSGLVPYTAGQSATPFLLFIAEPPATPTMLSGHL